MTTMIDAVKNKRLDHDSHQQVRPLAIFMRGLRNS